MVGGHLHPDAPVPFLPFRWPSWARPTRFCAATWPEEGDDLVLAVDLEGQRGCQSVVSWDANSGKTSGELLYRLEALPLIAERSGLGGQRHQQCRHIGYSLHHDGKFGKGAVISLPSIPAPGRNRSFRLADGLSKFQFYSLRSQRAIHPGYVTSSGNGILRPRLSEGSFLPRRSF